ncbi:MAG: hypothetical protein EBR82_69445, partial [Caulobacteraceae bacterium]|nr:hypothetical protein [Caulobacteraceae bacterium]
MYEKKSLEITKRYFDLKQQEQDEANQKIIQTEQDKNNRINQLLGVDVQIRRNEEIKLLQERLQTLKEMGDQETALYKQIQDAITKLQKEGLEERSSSARINAIQGTDEQAAAQREALEQQMNAKMEAE